MTEPEPDLPPNDILWGVAEIANYIRRNPRQTGYLIAKGIIPVKKLGPRTIVAFKSKIDRALAEQAEETSRDLLSRQARRLLYGK